MSASVCLSVPPLPSPSLLYSHDGEISEGEALCYLSFGYIYILYNYIYISEEEEEEEEAVTSSSNNTVWCG